MTMEQPTRRAADHTDASANPLRDLHRQAEAEFQPYGVVEIVSTFGEPQAEYAAVRKSCGMMDLPQRGFLELSGVDRLSFLNGLISAETFNKQTKQPMPGGRWVYSYFLNLKGRIVCDMNVLELGDRTLIELDGRLLEPMRQVFEAYHFVEQVKMRNREDLHEIALHGPGAREVLDKLGAIPAGFDDVQSCAVLATLGREAIVWRDDPSGTPGFHLIIPSDQARAIWMHLITIFGQGSEPAKRMLRPIGWAAFNATRIEAGRPIFGIDFDGAPPASAMPAKQQRDQGTSDESSPGVLPAETGQLARAVSLSKCYVGQEVVARMHARGQVARKLVGIRMESDALPIAGAQLLDESSNVIGVITSSTVSPVLSNAAICLGFVKRPHFEPGIRLRVPAEGQIRTGVVTDLPFVR
jgi:folate-binding protein YgfZ